MLDTNMNIYPFSRCFELMHPTTRNQTKRRIRTQGISTRGSPPSKQTAGLTSSPSVGAEAVTPLLGPIAIDGGRKRNVFFEAEKKAWRFEALNLGGQGTASFGCVPSSTRLGINPRGFGVAKRGSAGAECSDHTVPRSTKPAASGRTRKPVRNDSLPGGPRPVRRGTVREPCTTTAAV